MEPELQWWEGRAGGICRTVLDALPAWFGIPEAKEVYAAAAEREPTLVAARPGGPVGLLTLTRHSPESAEIVVMGVLGDQHRTGIGAALISGAEARLRAEGAAFLQVKTLSARHPDAGYAATRAFYAACGFVVLEEFPELWGVENPAVQLIKAL